MRGDRARRRMRAAAGANDVLEPSPVHCPACRGPLATFECDEVELDACPSGCGTWFDEGELELWASVEEVSSDARPAGVSAATPGTRTCPRCRALLGVLRLAEGLELDLCP